MNKNRIAVLVFSTLLGLEAIVVGQGQESSLNLEIDKAQRMSEAIRRATERVLPAVVAIETLSGPRVTPQWARREEKARQARRSPRRELADTHDYRESASDASASGVIIDRAGYILTCEHVVAEADVLRVVLPDGRSFEPTEVWTDPLTDLAVLHIEGAGVLAEARLANSDAVQVGDWVASCGHPYGLGPSVSIGIISATNRVLHDTPGTRFIQSDAASHPGNSGGPLINLQGEVVGISEGGFGATSSSQGVAIAIPSLTARRIAQDLIARGEVCRGYLGCEVETVSPAVAQCLRLQGGQGVIVRDIEPESAAAAAGLVLGDVMTHVASVAVHDGFQFGQLIQSSTPGRAYTLTIVRSGRTFTQDVELTRLVVTERKRPAPPKVPQTIRDGYRDELQGLVLEELTPQVASELGFSPATQGVLVTQVTPGTPAYKEGICAGMVIVRVDETLTRRLADYESARQAASSAEATLLLIAAPEGLHFVSLSHSH
jgi:serine protease Do